MSLTPNHKLAIVRILKVSPAYLDSHLITLGSVFTDDTALAVIELIEAWDSGAGSEYVKIYPKESNFGAEINPSLQKDDIKSSLTALLGLTGYFSSANETYLERG